MEYTYRRRNASANVRDNTIYSNNVGIRSTTASITIDNNTVYSNTAIGVQVGAFSLNITNNTLTQTSRNTLKAL